MVEPSELWAEGRPFPLPIKLFFSKRLQGSIDLWLFEAEVEKERGRVAPIGPRLQLP